MNEGDKDFHKMKMILGLATIAMMRMMMMVQKLLVMRKRVKADLDVNFHSFLLRTTKTEIVNGTYF